jgi:hypothetical protein
MRQLCGGGAHACRDLRVQSLPLAHASDVVSGFSQSTCPAGQLVEIPVLYALGGPFLSAHAN